MTGHKARGAAELLASVSDDITRCMRCGNCQAVCPIYAITRQEPAVARGKVHLAGAILKGRLSPNRALVKRFDTCLTCLACVANCPSNVRVDRIVLAVRALLAQEQGMPGVKRLACEILSRPRVLEAGSKLLARTEGLVFRKRATGMSPRFPLGILMRRVLPALPPTSFRQQSLEVHRAPGEVARVALFTGCMANYAYPDTARAAVRVLLASGVTVRVPREQHCCGYPVVSSGGMALAKEMARSHVRLFASLDVEAVIVLCGTCGEAFIHHYPSLLAGDPELESAAAGLADRTYEITRYLTSKRPLDPALLGRLDLHFTYHQPCHVGRGLGVTSEPLELLRAIPGATFSPLADPGRCCGGSGTFSFGHYDLADKVRRLKLADITRSGARVVATGCGSCRMHLEEGLAQANAPQRVLHTVEILARALTADRARA